MLLRFDEVPVGRQFIVGDCTYIKQDDRHATHFTGIGREVVDVFIPSNIVELVREPDKIWRRRCQDNLK